MRGGGLIDQFTSGFQATIEYPRGIAPPRVKASEPAACDRLPSCKKCRNHARRFPAAIASTHPSRNHESKFIRVSPLLLPQRRGLVRGELLRLIGLHEILGILPRRGHFVSLYFRRAGELSLDPPYSCVLRIIRFDKITGF